MRQLLVSIDRDMTDLFQNPVFLSAILSLFIAQFVKAVIVLLRTRVFLFREVIMTLLWKTGGMPSSHSALAVSIATGIGFTNGIGSDLFTLALFFALVVIRDAMGVRRATGLQAHALNHLGKELVRRLELPFHPVKEVHGHTLPQVFAGSLLGLSIAIAVCAL